MEENAVMNYEEEVLESEVVETKEGSDLSTGAAIAIGAGLALAATAVVKLVKKGIAKAKAKKELHKVEEGKTVEPTDEQIVEVTTPDK